MRRSGRLGLATSELAAATFFACSGLNHDEVETPEDYADILDLARARDLEFLCGNPDIVVRVGDRLVWCAGALARDYEARGGRVVMAGKPHPAIYRLAFAELARLAGREIPRSRILAIGDGINTDLLGANAQGIDALFIATGLHGEKLQTAGRLDPAKVGDALAAEGAHAAHMMAHLA
jgi:HAD superfamily hydrolase (TIGR01459 family)